jgi:hypothetical protein
MMCRRPLHSFWIFLLAALPAFSQNGTSLQVNNRLQAGWEQDDNVFEALRRPVASSSFRLLYDGRGRMHSGRWAAQLGYQGGLQIYQQVEKENKLINDLRLDLTLKISDRLQFGGQGYARLKLFLNRPDDYALGRWQIFLQGRVPAAVTIRAGYAEEAMDYATTDFYSYYSPGFFLNLQRGLGRGWTLSPQLTWSSPQFDRSAFKSSAAHNFLPAAHRQKDGLLTAGLGVDWVHSSLLVSLLFRNEHNSSNSYGYSYDRQVVTLSFVKNFAGFFLRGYGGWQKKNYLDDLLPFYPLQLDTEREENNFLVLDLSREVTSFMVVLLRAAWYENESPWASLYYQKRLLSLGTELKF